MAGVRQVKPAICQETVELDADDLAWLDERVREYRELLVLNRPPLAPADIHPGRSPARPVVRPAG